jgi:hypothetical protein
MLSTHFFALAAVALSWANAASGIPLLGPKPASSTVAAPSSTRHLKPGNTTIQFADVNLIHLTDVHSWLSGHPHEKENEASYADVLAFIQHLQVLPLFVLAIYPHLTILFHMPGRRWRGHRGRTFSFSTLATSWRARASPMPLTSTDSTSLPLSNRCLSQVLIHFRCSLCIPCANGGCLSASAYFERGWGWSVQLCSRGCGCCQR